MNLHSYPNISSKPVATNLDLTLLDTFIQTSVPVFERLVEFDAWERKTIKNPSDNHGWPVLDDMEFAKKCEKIGQTWVSAMLEVMPQDEFLTGLATFGLHTQMIVFELPNAPHATRVLSGMHRMIEALFISGFQCKETQIPASKMQSESMLHALAFMLTDLRPENWRSRTWMSNDTFIFKYFHASFDDPNLNELQGLLAQQIISRRLWLNKVGQLVPSTTVDAQAFGIDFDRLEPEWRSRIRLLLAAALKRGWIDGAGLRAFITDFPNMVPWWLLVNPEAELEKFPGDYRDFSLYLRRSFPAALDKLRGDISANLECWTDLPEFALCGFEGLLGAARWAQRSPKVASSPNTRDLFFYLSFVSGPFDNTPPEKIVAELREFRQDVLLALLPRAGTAQSLVMRALGLSDLEPFRCWMVRAGQENPELPGILTDLIETSTDATEGVVNVAELRVATQGGTPEDCALLASAYTKAGMLSGMDKLVDAFFGKLDREKLQADALVKQNQFAIRLYGLLPIFDKDELRQRYVALQSLFQTASKHGAQKQATQRAAVQVALSHLGQVAGFDDDLALEWAMELENAGTLQADFTPAKVGAFEVWIHIERLRAQLRIRDANGKHYERTPAALKKDTAFTRLNQQLSEVREQLRRFTRLLEKRMIFETWISTEQLIAALAHPVMKSIIESLVWEDQHERIGLFNQQGLVGPDGIFLTTDKQVRLVHVAHLLVKVDGAAKLTAWQRWIVGKQHTQAFKQMFRETYAVTPAELQSGRSTRYTGRVLGSGIAQGILRARQWVPPAEEGHRTFRKFLPDGVSAYCDFEYHGRFFTEDPEVVTGELWFEQNGKQLWLRDVGIVSFSEAMRDIDLVISQAVLDTSADGSEPYGSQSTIDARKELLQAIAPSLEDGALTCHDRHVWVRGRLASYRIHLISGHVFVEPGAYICIIPDPNASGRRDPAVLPFVDEDLKTAEIVGKVMLLAHDYDIEDPDISRQIQSFVRERESP